MSLVHLHLLLNHVPVIGSVFAVLVLILALRLRSNDVARVGLATLLMVGVVAGAVFLTGEPAEDAIENVAGISRATIEQHEEAADAALVAATVAGLVALGALLLNRGRQIPRLLTAAALGCSLIVVGFMAWTANLGGQIRHSEIRVAAAATDRGSDAGEREAAERDGRPR